MRRIPEIFMGVEVPRWRQVIIRVRNFRFNDTKQAILRAVGELIFSILLEKHFSPPALPSRAVIHDN